MKIVTRRCPCKVEMVDNQKFLKIEYDHAPVIENDQATLSELPEPTQENIMKVGKQVADANERTKSLKLSFMKDGDTGTIDLIYVV